MRVHHKTADEGFVRKQWAGVVIRTVSSSFEASGAAAGASFSALSAIMLRVGWGWRGSGRVQRPRLNRSHGTAAIRRQKRGRLHGASAMPALGVCGVVRRLPGRPPPPIWVHLAAHSAPPDMVLICIILTYFGCCMSPHRAVLSLICMATVHAHQKSSKFIFGCESYSYMPFKKMGMNELRIQPCIDDRVYDVCHSFSLQLSWHGDHLSSSATLLRRLGDRVRWGPTLSMSGGRPYAAQGAASAPHNLHATPTHRTDRHI